MHANRLLFHFAAAITTTIAAVNIFAAAVCLNTPRFARFVVIQFWHCLTTQITCSRIYFLNCESERKKIPEITWNHKEKQYRVSEDILHTSSIKWAVHCAMYITAWQLRNVSICVQFSIPCFLYSFGLLCFTSSWTSQQCSRFTMQFIMHYLTECL